MLTATTVWAVLFAATSCTEETHELAAALAELVVAGDLLVLSGDLGAGKTAFTKGFGAALGVDEIITSPTFTLVQTYEGAQLRLYHLDVYRLEYLGEASDLGLEEMLDDQAVTVIEWGDAISSVLPADHLRLRFLAVGDDERRIEISSSGARWAGLRNHLVSRCRHVQWSPLGERQDTDG